MGTLVVGSLLNGRRADEVVQVPASTSVMDTARLMAEQAVSAVLVMDGAGLPVGVFSERELLERVVAAGRELRTTPLSLVANRDVKCVPSMTSAEAALALMHLDRYPYLLVVDGPVASGLVSMRDLASQLVTNGEGRYESTLRLAAVEKEAPAARAFVDGVVAAATTRSRAGEREEEAVA